MLGHEGSTCQRPIHTNPPGSRVEDPDQKQPLIRVGIIVVVLAAAQVLYALLHVVTTLD